MSGREKRVGWILNDQRLPLGSWRVKQNKSRVVKSWKVSLNQRGEFFTWTQKNGGSPTFLAHTDRLFISLELLPSEVETPPFKYLIEIQEKSQCQDNVYNFSGEQITRLQLVHKRTATVSMNFLKKMTKGPVKHAASEIPSCYKGCFEKKIFFFKYIFILFVNFKDCTSTQVLAPPLRPPRFLAKGFSSCELVCEAAPLDSG